MRGVSKQPLALAFVPSGLRSPLVLTGENPQNESLMASRGELEHTHQSLCIELDLGTLRDQITEALLIYTQSKTTLHFYFIYYFFLTLEIACSELLRSNTAPLAAASLETKLRLRRCETGSLCHHRLPARP